MRRALRLLSVQPLNDLLSAGTVRCEVRVNFHFFQDDSSFQGMYRYGQTRTAYRKVIEFPAYFFQDLAGTAFYWYEEDFIARLSNCPPITVATKTHSTQANLLAAITPLLPFIPDVTYTVAYCGVKRVNLGKSGIFYAPQSIEINIQDINRLKYKFSLLMCD